ncbi:MAG: primosomal protein N' (replication factor Y) - superfamily II helicase [Paracoccaceae bacterium]
MAETERHWPCESCGADLRFAPGQTRLVCDHCGHVQDIPPADAVATGKLHEVDLQTGLREDLQPGLVETIRTTRCPSCGALVEFRGAEHSTECPFCATPVTIGTGEARLIKPQGVVPFRITEPQARNSMTTWLGNLWFAPNGLVEYARKGRAMNGIYVPYWTFDAATRSRYRGARGEYYYETRTVMVEVNGRMERRQEQVRHIRWYPVAGRVSRFFDDVLVMASRSLPRSYVDALAPWDFGDLVPYNADYLAGFSAEGYTVSLSEGHQQGQEIMGRVILNDVRRDIGGDEQRVEGIDTDYSGETFKHILLPIWTAAYRYGGKSYRFVVNGQTGKVQGERPWSVWKIAFAVLLAVAAAGAFAWLNQNGEFINFREFR